MALIHAALLLLVATGICVGSSATKVSVDDLIKNKRTGKIVWGGFYDIPKVNGARASTYLEMPAKGTQPMAAGVKLTKQFLDNAAKIPCEYLEKNTKGLEKSCISSMMFSFPAGSVFKFMYLNYATGGHAPVGIYSLPHFDIHFYLKPQKWLMDNIGPATMGNCSGFNPRTWYLINRPIPKQCFPKRYANVGSAVPVMGNHMMNPVAHEFTKPGSFNKTFLYGTFGGNVVFFEPMITRKTFLDKKAFCGPMPGRPSEFRDAGWYPSTYCFFSYANGDTFIELRDFLYQKGPGCKRPAKEYDGYLLADPKTIPAGCSYVKPPAKPKGK